MSDNTVETYSAVAGRKPWSKTKKAFVFTMGAGAVGGFLWLVSLPSHSGQADGMNGSGDKTGEVGDAWSPIAHAATHAAATPAPPPPMPPQAQTMAAFSSPDPGAPISRVPIVQFQAGPPKDRDGRRDGGQDSYGTTSASPGGRAVNPDSGRLSDDTSVATMLPDRNLFITMGTPIPCSPEQPINTDQPGPFRCKVQQAIYSTSGEVRLLDPGTWLVGEVTQSLGRGNRRAFAIMHRIETPQGCLVRLHSPVGDSMGEAGLDGQVNTHFWERFRGYAMIALLDAAGQAAALGAASAMGGNNSNINLYQFQGAGSQLGQNAYGDDINIPNTLQRHQALPMVAMVTSDIDMRPCFDLVAK